MRRKLLKNVLYLALSKTTTDTVRKMTTLDWESVQLQNIRFSHSHIRCPYIFVKNEQEPEKLFTECENISLRLVWFGLVNQPL